MKLKTSAEFNGIVLEIYFSSIFRRILLVNHFLLNFIRLGLRNDFFLLCASRENPFSLNFWKLLFENYFCLASVSWGLKMKIFAEFQSAWT